MSDDSIVIQLRLSPDLSLQTDDDLKAMGQMVKFQLDQAFAQRAFGSADVNDIAPDDRGEDGSE